MAQVLIGTSVINLKDVDEELAKIVKQEKKEGINPKSLKKRQKMELKAREKVDNEKIKDIMILGKALAQRNRENRKLIKQGEEMETNVQHFKDDIRLNERLLKQQRRNINTIKKRQKEFKQRLETKKEDNDEKVERFTLIQKAIRSERKKREEKAKKEKERKEGKRVRRKN